ncbi:site-specific integrase [Sphaerimonospora mesophila]|uniref:tyrosine-type recombinase/integrase n=1 Tax=Sphaerimonospora mesophila TaxID=37483 RepID=UPI00190FC32C
MFCEYPSHAIPRHSPHVMRHTAASWPVQAGVSPYVVQDPLGHEDHRTTRRYAIWRRTRIMRCVRRGRRSPTHEQRTDKEKARPLGSGSGL